MIMALRPTKDKITAHLVLKAKVAQLFSNALQCSKTLPANLPSVQTHQAEKLVPRLLSFLYASQHAACDCCCTGFLYSSHDHAKVARLHYHCHSLGLENLHDCVCNIFCQALLDLETSGEHVCDSREFRDTDNVSIRDISNVHLQSQRPKPLYVFCLAYLSRKWNHMMLA